ncbi:MAG TPA: hypothetical protein DHV26_18050 [Cytophagales bacterium]|nr:hypothetical protein [Cytophagales bacterium]HRG06940.1 DinB family protein [Cyclobacteriaceae bacterium]
MKQFFLKWYNYNAWANRTIISCLERQSVNDEKILTILGHLVSANFIWLNRIKGLPKSEFKLWGNYSLIQLKQMVEDADAQWMDFIKNNDDFNRLLKYNNYVGDYYESNVEQIMIHLVNHGSYHRGQVAMLLRQNGFEPVNTDYITYDRVLSGQLPNS